jgi:hypothetical protein
MKILKIVFHIYESSEASRLARSASYGQHASDTTYHTLVLKEVNQSFHTCPQDI